MTLTVTVTLNAVAVQVTSSPRLVLRHIELLLILDASFMYLLQLVRFVVRNPTVLNDALCFRNLIL